MKVAIASALPGIPRRITIGVFGFSTALDVVPLGAEPSDGGEDCPSRPVEGVPAGAGCGGRAAAAGDGLTGRVGACEALTWLTGLAIGWIAGDGAAGCGDSLR